MTAVPGVHLIGRGYDIRAAFADPESTRAQVLKPSTEADLDVLVLRTGEQVVFTSRTLVEQRDKFSMRVGVEASYGNFSSSVEVKHRSDEHSENEYAFVNIRDIVKTHRIGRRLVRPQNTAQLEDLCTPEFVDDLDALTPEALVDAYGTHVLISAVMGGCFDYASSFLRREQWTEVQLTTSSMAAYNGVVGSTRVEIDTDEISETHVLQVRSGERIGFRGGDQALGLKIGGIDESGAFAAWADTVPGAPELVDLPHGALVAIWELLPNADRRTEVRRTIERILRRAETPRWGVGRDKAIVWVPRGTTTADWNLIVGPAQAKPAPGVADYRGLRWAKWQATTPAQAPSDHFRLDLGATGSARVDGDDAYSKVDLNVEACWMLVPATESVHGSLSFDAPEEEKSVDLVAPWTTDTWSLIVSPTRIGKVWSNSETSVADHKLVAGFEIEVDPKVDKSGWIVKATSSMISGSGTTFRSLDVDYLLVFRGSTYAPLSVAGTGAPPLELRVPAGDTGAWAAFAAPTRLGKLDQDDLNRAVRAIDFDVGYRDAIRFAADGELSVGFWKPIPEANYALFGLGAYLVELLPVGFIIGGQTAFSDLDALASASPVEELRFRADDELHAVGVKLGNGVETLWGEQGPIHQRLVLFPGEYCNTVTVWWDGDNDDIRGIYIGLISGRGHISPKLGALAHTYVAPTGYEIAGFHGLASDESRIRRLGVIVRRRGLS